MKIIIKCLFLPWLRIKQYTIGFLRDVSLDARDGILVEAEGEGVQIKPNN